MSFTYDLGAKITRITDEELRAGLRRFAARNEGKAFRVRDFAAWRGRPFSPNTAIRRFGSWADALGSIGIAGARRRRYGPEELAAECERVWRELGRPPGERSLAARGRFSKNAYKWRWGTVRALCELLARQHRGEISREEVLRGVRRVPARKTLRVHVRWDVLKRDRYRCVACGRSPSQVPGLELHIDHVVPVSRGGGNEIENLRTLCRECNVGRGDERRGERVAA